MYPYTRECCNSTQDGWPPAYESRRPASNVVHNIENTVTAHSATDGHQHSNRFVLLQTLLTNTSSHQGNLSCGVSQKSNRCQTIKVQGNHMWFNKQDFLDSTEPWHEKPKSFKITSIQSIRERHSLQTTAFATPQNCQPQSKQSQQSQQSQQSKQRPQRPQHPPRPPRQTANTLSLTAKTTPKHGPQRQRTQGLRHQLCV